MAQIEMSCSKCWPLQNGERCSARDKEANDIGERTDRGHGSQPDAHKPEQTVEYRLQ